MIEYRTGNAALPIERLSIIAHVVNDAGRWGAGFTSSLDTYWPTARQSFQRPPMRLGQVRLAPVGEDVFVLHMCAQHGVYDRVFNPRPFSLSALDSCLSKIDPNDPFEIDPNDPFEIDPNDPFEIEAKITLPTSVLHMPRIGAGLGRGHWPDIEGRLRSISSLMFRVYDLPKPA